jgi:hypothetical protein
VATRTCSAGVGESSAKSCVAGCWSFRDVIPSTQPLASFDVAFRWCTGRCFVCVVVIAAELDAKLWRARRTARVPLLRTGYRDIFNCTECVNNVVNNCVLLQVTSADCSKPKETRIVVQSSHGRVTLPLFKALCTQCDTVVCARSCSLHCRCWRVCTEAGHNVARTETTQRREVSSNWQMNVGG